MPAARSAPPCSRGTSCSTTRARPTAATRQQGSLLGPRYTTDEICEFLDGLGVTYHAASQRARAASTRWPICSTDDKVVGWFQGRMEFGPRALGARSIIGDPRSPTHAGHDEPQDQVPRELPAVRADRARVGGASSGSASRTGRRAPTCCSSRRCARSTAWRSTRRRGRRWRATRPAQPRQRPAVDHSGGHARGLQRAPADRGRRRATRA